MARPDARPDLRPDCTRCAGLCCVALAFEVSSEFAIDKLPGRPCPNLDASFRCTVHERLRESGFAGCAAFDCFGAGQHATQVTFSGRSWRDEPAIGPTMFAVFDALRELKAALWYLAEARMLARSLDETALAAEVDQTWDLAEELTMLDPAKLERLDTWAFHQDVAGLLGRVSESRRRSVRTATGAVLRAADLTGADLRSEDLRGADLRGALLTGARLSGNDLFAADLLGADLRGADLRGSRLAECLFLTQSQIESGQGDLATTIPPELDRPSHWARRTLGRPPEQGGHDGS